MILLHTSRAIRSLSVNKQLSTQWGCCCRCGLAQPRVAGSSCVLSASSAAVSTEQSQQLVNAEVRLSDLQGRIGPLSTVRSVPEAKPVVLVVSGPSGVGKDAVLRKLQELRPSLYFVVTATSRAMRLGEVDGHDYLFVSREKFEEWIAEDQLLEHAMVYGEYKGIPRNQVTEALARGTDVALRLDVQGAATVRKLYPDAVFLFLVAESEETLVQRLVERKSEALVRTPGHGSSPGAAQESMLLRVRTAQQELSCMESFDYVVVNRAGQLDATVQQINAIMDAEKCSAKRLFRPRPA